MAKFKVDNKTGIAELDAIIQTTSKKRGVDLSGIRLGEIVPFSTGSMQLDLALKVGGMPQGRVIEIFGQESTMKTSLSLTAIAKKQQARLQRQRDRLADIAAGVTDAAGELLKPLPAKRDLILDIEHSLTDPFIEGFGIDLDQCIILQPNSAEEALQVSIDYVKSGAIDCVLFDSVDAMQNEKQQRRQVGENDVGGISKDMAFAMRRISKLAVQHNTTYIFINQIKMNPGVMFGSPETTPGGSALRFYASLRLKCMSRKPCPTIPNATTMRVKIQKTKLGGDFKEVLEIPFIFGTGFATALDIEAVAKELGILSHSAGQTKMIWVPDAEKEPLLERHRKRQSSWTASTN